MRLVGTAASGLRAQQISIDNIGNNLANTNTPGFKANQIDFAEALATEVLSGYIGTEENDNTVIPLDIGSGVIYNPGSINFQQGSLDQTGRALDLGIEGLGFFQVMTPDGETGFTRGGAFQIDGNRQLADMQGNVLQPSILIPAEATEVAVTGKGDITGVINGERRVFGQILLAGFRNSNGLQRMDNNLFIPTVNSGEPQVGQPGSVIAGDQLFGTIRGQSLEQSNVNFAASMADLVQVQRAYQMSARLVQDGDKMWGIANTMRR